MKLKEFLQDSFSPSKGSVKLNTKGIIEEYRDKYDQLLSSGKKFKHDTYTVTPGNKVIVHIKVPSETVDNFYYDVLFELTAEKSAADFRDCDIKVFSNCPSFVYTVAYVFAHWNPDSKNPAKKTGMMIDSLRGKLPRDRMLIPGTEKALGRKPVHEKPVVRNPMGIPLFDKSIYFAIFYMLDEMEYRSTMENHHNVSMSRVVATVMEFDKLMAQRKRAEKQAREKKRVTRQVQDKVFENHEKKLDAANRSGMKSPKPLSSTIRVSSGGMRSTRSTHKVKSVGKVGSTRRDK